ncbi:Magnesium transport protein CorA [Candidatus Rubidus massiliensis]|nr:MAG: magnesium and cobalt transport protein CorA [Chlamydia sp. 32-24]CDZ80056.1 Magnesium transport protein CorA [Candidatus Rubidus massiliensis]
MFQHNKKLSKKIGLPPGSIVHIGNFANTPVTVSLVEYFTNEVNERVLNPKSISFDSLDKNKNNWLIIQGISDVNLLKNIGSAFHLHPLLLEDIAHSGQRAKLDDFQESCFIILKFIHLNQKTSLIEEEQISLILQKNLLISFQESDHEIFTPIIKRLKQADSQLKDKGVDRLCYSIIDFIVDKYFEVIEYLDDTIEKLDQELINRSNSSTLLKILRAKKDISYLRKNIWPVREVISKFIKLDRNYIEENTKLWMNDVQDHVIQAVDNIETFRDLAGTMIDIYISNINMKMNEIIKVLTIITTIFVPLTFVASIYGMNFDNMPELHWKWGYPFTLGIMALIFIGMLIYFRQKKWI